MATFQFGSTEGKKRYRFGHYWPEAIGLAGLMIALDGASELESFGDPIILTASAVSLGCFFLGFFRKLRDFRAVANVPTSRIATASQGFGEFNCRVHKDCEQFVAPQSGVPCVWYHHVVRERRGSGKDARWVVVSESASGKPIWLSDHSGQSMLAHPGFMIQSDLICDRHKIGSREHLVYTLTSGEAVMVNGQFATFDAVSLQLAHHLLGPKGTDDDAKNCLPTLEAMVSSWQEEGNAAQRLHAIGYCDFNSMGMIHSGSEEEYLKDKKRGLILSAIGLGAAFVFSSLSILQMTGFH